MESLGLIWKLVQLKRRPKFVGMFGSICSKMAYWTELEMPDSPWLSVDEGILRLREIVMLERVCCVKPNPPPWEAQKTCPSPILWDAEWWGVPAQVMDELCCHLFFVPNLRVGDAAAHLNELNAVSLSGPQGSRVRWQPWITKRRLLKLL